MFSSSMSWGYLENKLEVIGRAIYIDSKNVKRNSELWVSPTRREEELSLSPTRAPPPPPPKKKTHCTISNKPEKGKICFIAHLHKSRTVICFWCGIMYRCFKFNEPRNIYSCVIRTLNQACATFYVARYALVVSITLCARWQQDCTWLMPYRNTQIYTKAFFTSRIS